MIKFGIRVSVVTVFQEHVHGCRRITIVVSNEKKTTMTNRNE